MSPPFPAAHHLIASSLLCPGPMAPRPVPLQLLIAAHTPDPAPVPGGGGHAEGPGRAFPTKLLSSRKTRSRRSRSWPRCASWPTAPSSWPGGELGAPQPSPLPGMCVRGSGCCRGLGAFPCSALTRGSLWSSPEEAARYLETYKAYELKPADLLMEKLEHNFLSRVRPPTHQQPEGRPSLVAHLAHLSSDAASSREPRPCQVSARPFG